MIEIIKIKLYDLHNPEYIRLMKLLLKICTDHGVSNLKIEDQHKALQAKYLEMDKIYEQQQGSTITGLMEKADMRRDRAISGIVLHVDSKTYYFDDNIAAAAVTLKADLDKYGGGIARTNYATESTIIDNIVNEWKNDTKLNMAMQQLGLLQWVDELDAANKEFERLYLLRNKEISKSSDDSVGKLRVQSDVLYEDLTKMLESQARVNKFVAPFDSAIRECNTILEDFNDLIARRASKSKGDDPQDTDPTPKDGQ